MEKPIRKSILSAAVRTALVPVFASELDNEITILFKRLCVLLERRKVLEAAMKWGTLEP